MNPQNKRDISTILKYNLTIVLIVFITPFLLGQKAFTSTYKKEFKNVGRNEYSKKIISLSTTKNNSKWNNYVGGSIHTDDSLFFFNGDQLSHSFPTNASHYRNDILIYYFSQKTAKCPILFSLSNYYDPIITEHLAENKLPKELKLLPVVLAAFNPNSNNGMGGTGYWHLNYPQAIKYGLTVNDLVDERRDFEKSTKAATRYLKDLYNKYNDWELTLTAYSSGVVTVNKLLKRHTAKSYKEIYPYLPEETKNLVEAFVAMNYVYNYDTYGAVLLNPIIDADTIIIDRKLKFEAINQVIGTNTKDFKFLNPVLNKDLFPSKFTAYFPKGKGEEFAQLKDSIYFYQDSVMLKPKVDEPEFVIPKDGEPFVYKVRSGDVLGLIADRHNVRVSQLQAWNNLNGTMINVGQKLTIYGKGNATTKKPVIPTTTTKKTQINKKKPTTVQKKTTEPVIVKQQPTGKYSTYTVKSGDNLWVIAKKYSGVSAQNIMDFNKINGNLTVGQTIKIPKY